jgi:hypothetical protein
MLDGVIYKEAIVSERWDTMDAYRIGGTAGCDWISGSIGGVIYNLVIGQVLCI